MSKDSRLGKITKDFVIPLQSRKRCNCFNSLGLAQIALFRLRLAIFAQSYFMSTIDTL